MQKMSLTNEELEPLSVNQIKKISTLMDKAVQETNKKLEETEKERNSALREMGNHLHSSCHVSNDEVKLKLVLSRMDLKIVFKLISLG